jgi:hypothetical protein
MQQPKMRGSASTVCERSPPASANDAAITPLLLHALQMMSARWPNPADDTFQNDEIIEVFCDL